MQSLLIPGIGVLAALAIYFAGRVSDANARKERENRKGECHTTYGHHHA